MTCFERLIAVRVSGKHNQLSLPRRLLEGLPKQPWRILLDDKLALKIGSSTKSPILMGWTGITIGAGMKAAAIGVHTPPKRQVGTVVTTQDLSTIVRIERQFGDSRRLKEVPMPRLKGVGGIGDPTHRAYPLPHA